MFVQSTTRRVTCTIGTLASGAQATVTIVNADNGKGTISNTVAATTTTPESNTTNNNSTISIRLR